MVKAGEGDRSWVEVGRGRKWGEASVRVSTIFKKGEMR